MAKIAIVYGTAEGQTEKITAHIADIALQHGHLIEVHNAKHLPGDFVLDQFDAVLVGASIHSRQYPISIQGFVKSHRDYLMRTPSALFTVCLTASQATPEARAIVQQDVSKFEQETGWVPAKAGAFAGALNYTKAGILKRYRMKKIARQVGAATDTTRDWEFTDWNAVTQFAEEYFGAGDWAVTSFEAA